MIGKFNLSDPIQHHLFLPDLQCVLKLMNLRLRNRICPDRHIDSGTLFQYFIKLTDTVTEIQNDHIIITVINDLLQKTDPLLCRGTLDIFHGKYRRQIVLKLARTKHTPKAVDAIYSYSNAHRSEYFCSLELNPGDMF